MKMNYKGLIFLSFILLTFLIPLIMADWADDLKTNLAPVKKLFDPVTNLLFGSQASAGNLTTTYVLTFMLIMLIIYGVLNMVNIFGEGKGWLNLMIGALVALIGIRFVPAGMLETAAMPSSGLVLLMIMGIPFIVLFFVLEKFKSALLRRAMWAAYAAIMIVLWISNWNNANLNGWRWVYAVIIGACIVAFWFDGTLQKWFGAATAKRTIAEAESVEVERLTAKVEDLMTAYANEKDASKQESIGKQIKRLKESIQKLQKL